MFMAGAVPGLLLGVAMMVTCYVISRRNGYPVQTWQGFGELARSFASALWAIAMTALIIGGLVTGVATPTETAVVACIYAFLVGAFVYRGLKIRDVPRIIIQSGVSSAAILALVGFANVFGWILSTERIPQAIVGAVLGITENRILVILLINLVLLFVGMFMETIAALIILFVPMLALATSVGVDPIHFATFAVLNLMLGLTTPPLGVCLFVCGSIARVSLQAVVRAIAPFLICNLAVLMLVSYIPALSTWLPTLVFGK
jgi:C4-dicarboxylate transporter, DctM subunit